MHTSDEKRISRRSFIKGSAMGAAGVLAGSMLSAGAKAQQVDSRIPDKWDYEADVVVLGLGGAGASAAIEAHDGGAKVLILEKQPEATHFSNTRMSGGFFHNPDPSCDRKALVEYVKAMMCGKNIPWKLEGEQPHVSDDMAEMYADGVMEVADFLMAQAPDLNRSAMGPSGKSSFPMFPGYDGAKYGGLVYCCYKDLAKADQNLPLYERPRLTKGSGEAFHWALVEDGIKTKRPGIKILYETPAKRLVQRPNGEVIGVIATREGRDIAVKAKKAVILATGGFEYSLPMRRAFLEGPGVKGWSYYGSTANTGDGILMGILAGAALAKVGKSASRIEPAFPYGDVYEKSGLKIGAMSAITSVPHSIIVDNYGERYTDEHIITDSSRPYRYQFYKEAVKYDMLNMVYSRVPSWLIFDENVRADGPVVNTLLSTAGYGFIPWSKDNMDAINRGWILRADSIDELAKKIQADPENRKLMDADRLAETVKMFNSYCALGKDEQFGRTPATMGPVEKPPFYAMKMYPGGPNTKGGLDANADRCVLDWNGNPIPRLFAAGEIASVFKFTYQGGGNLTECIVCGRQAGRNAAKLAPWS